ncbi:MAG: OstA-like protein [Bacteroidia bacterium]
MEIDSITDCDLRITNILTQNLVNVTAMRSNFPIFQFSNFPIPYILIFNRKYFLLLIAFITSGNLFAQKKTKIEILNADVLTAEVVNKQEVRKLKGNVQLKQDDVLMFCDSAYLFTAKNSLTAYNNVRITQGDSLTLTGNRLDYDGNKKYAIVKENVVLQDRQMTLTTDRLDYDMNKKVAFYLNGGTMTDAENRLYSKRGYYHSKSRDLFFRKEVELINPQYTMNCDTLQYNIITRKAFFHGPTTIKSANDFIYCETGWYNTSKNLAQFGKNAFLNSGSQYLYGDSLYYNRNKDFGKAVGNIRVIDTVENLLIEGQYAEHFSKLRKTFITKKVLVTKGFEKDSMFMTGDTIRSAYDTSGKYRILYGYNHVKVYNKDFQAACDSLIYSFVDSTMDLRIDPVFWFGVYQGTAENILVHTSQNNVTRVDLNQKSFILNREDSLRYGQVKGRNMVGLFRENALYQIDVNGNGESIYYVRDDDSAYIGMNKIASSNIKIGVKEQKVTRINFMQDPDAVLYPIKEADPAEFRLQGFRWRASERPLNVEALRPQL